MTKYLLLDSENVILHISTTIDYQENGNPLVDGGTLAYAEALVVQVIEVDHVPEEVSAHQYCYVDGEFVLNPNWIEPEEPTDWDYALRILDGEVDYDGE